MLHRLIQARQQCSVPKTRLPRENAAETEGKSQRHLQKLIDVEMSSLIFQFVISGQSRDPWL